MAITREYKGKSIIALPSDYVSIDLETTGFSPEYDEIIEIGCIRYRNGIEVDSFQSLVKPHDMDLVDSYIVRLTGITPDMLESASYIETVLPLALDFIGQDIVIGHNVSFDVNFLYDNTVRLGLSPFGNDYIDTRRLCRRAFPHFTNYKLKTLVKEFGIPVTDAHRAEADARQTALCYEYMSNYIISNDLFGSIVPHHPGHSIKAREIVGIPEMQNEDSPLFGKIVVFTGTLERMSRKEAMQLVANLGGKNGDSVTKKTNFLVLGNNDMCNTIKDGKSNKQKKAEQYILDGADLMILPENVFYDMLSEAPKVVEKTLTRFLSPAVPAHGAKAQIPAPGLQLTDLEKDFVDRLSDILSSCSNFNELQIVQRSSNYLTVLAGMNDFLRFKYSHNAKWITLDLPRELVVQNKDNPLFAAQKNKAQRHWKAMLSSLDDLDAMKDFILASCIIRYYD